MRKYLVVITKYKYAKRIGYVMWKNRCKVACLFLLAICVTSAQAATVDADATLLNAGRRPTYSAGDTIRVTGMAQLNTTGWQTLASATQNFSLELENRQTSIPNRAMYSNGYLTSLTANSVTTVGTDAFTASVLTSASLPAATTIGEAAFANSRLASIFLPAARTIGARAFSGCPLTDVSLPAATNIGDFAFNECSRLTSASLPAATGLGLRAFYGSALTRISLPRATRLGNESFSGASSLTSASLPAVTAIGERAFDGCVALGELYLDKADPTTGANAFRDVPYGLLIYASRRHLKGTAYPAGYRLVTSASGGGGGCNAGAPLTALAAWMAIMAVRQGLRKNRKN
jgi:hypothetical protein